MLIIITFLKICSVHEMVLNFYLTYSSFTFFFMSLVDVIAYVHKKKKLVSSHCPATTAIKTSVSLQI